MARFILNTKSKNPLSIRNFYERRNKVLIIRETGGLGDMLMSRMIFEDFKLTFPESHLLYAIPKYYYQALENHPFIDEIVDTANININDFNISYDISTACGRYESFIAPKSDKHRSDIWAEHCGLTLKNHNMHLKIDEDLTRECKKKLGDQKTILFCPISAMTSKDLDVDQINGVIKGLKEWNIIGLHKEDIRNVEMPVIISRSIQEYLAYINATDYIITVDTASVHAAGGLKKPTVGIFSWACGKIYCKYYPTVEVVQIEQQLNNWQCSCYSWGLCVLDQKSNRKPCINNISANMIIDAFNKLVDR